MYCYSKQHLVIIVSGTAKQLPSSPALVLYADTNSLLRHPRQSTCDEALQCRSVQTIYVARDA